MRALWPFARRSLLGRRARTAALIAAVALASSLIVAVTSGLRTAQASVEHSINRAMGVTDARIVHRYAEPFDAALLAQVRSWNGVTRAAGRLFGSITLESVTLKSVTLESVTLESVTLESVTLESVAARATGERALRATTQARGIMPDEDAFFREVEITDGRRVQGAFEVVLDPATARTLKAKVGDRLRIARFGAPIEVTVVGLYARPQLGALQRPLVEIDLATLATASKHEGELTSISIALAEGIDATAWCNERAAQLREPLVCEPAERVRTGLDKQIIASELMTLVATMIAFLSCAAIIATGMTTAVLEELREMGIARAIGATRRQLFGAQLLIGGVIGVLGGALGIPIGLALIALLATFYAEHLHGGVTLDGRGLLLAISGAVVSGLAGALFPAVRAARISPLAAIVIRSRAPRKRSLVLGTLAALTCLVLCGLCLWSDDANTRFWLYIFGGLPLLHIAWFLLAVPITLLVARVISPLLERALRLPHGLLAGSIQRMPWRFGCTAGALMVAVSILVSTRSNGESIIRDLRERVRFADGFVFCTSGLSKDEQARIASLANVTGALRIGYLPLRVAGKQLFGVEGLGPTNVVCVGFDPVPFLELNRLDWLQGTPEAAIPRLLDGDAILVAPEFLIARNMGVGSKLRLGSGAHEAEFEIVGVVSAAGLDIATQTFGMRQIYMEQAVSCVFMDFAAVERHFDTRDAYIMQLKLTQGLSADDEQKLADAVSDTVGGAVFSSGRAIRSFVDEVGSALLAITSAVAFAALALASIGVGSVVAAGISARSREFGVLRAIGARTRVLVALVLAETLIIAIAAVLTGTLLGLQLAWIATGFYRDFAGLSLHPTFPLAPLLVGGSVVILVALLAAVPSLLRLIRTPTRELIASV